MIHGVGIDILKISRIKNIVRKYGEIFLYKLYSEAEIESIKKINDNQRKYSFCAKRFSAKEAIAKSIGFGFGSKIQYKDISISNNMNGKPMVDLSGQTLNTIKNLPNPICTILISISDEREYVVSYATAISTIN